MYVPTLSEVKNEPQFNTFYRAPRSESVLVSQIANRARKRAGLGGSFIWRTIRAIAASKWNRSHINYSSRGYENYNIKGPQYMRKYAPSIMAQPGTGDQYPVLWIPDPRAPLEPAKIFKADVSTSTARRTEPIPADVVQDIVEKKPKIILQPKTQEDSDIAMSLPEVTSDKEAAIIEAAAETSEIATRTLADPTASPHDKTAAAQALKELGTEIAQKEPQKIAAKQKQIIDSNGAEPATEPVTEPATEPAIEPVTDKKNIMKAFPALSFALLLAKAVSE